MTLFRVCKTKSDVYQTVNAAGEPVSVNLQEAP